MSTYNIVYKEKKIFLAEVKHPIYFYNEPFQKDLGGQVQSTFNGLNVFGNMDICSRYG